MRLENISKHFITASGEKVKIFENFNLEFEKGLVTCISGPSGSGKTTLLNLIASLILPDSGTVHFEYGEEKISYIFQHPRLLSWKTVYENCMLVCNNKEKTLQNLEMVGLESKLSRYPKELSVGEQQRVGIARAFCFDGNTYLMDECFQNLDFSLAFNIASVIFPLLKRAGKTVVWVSHNKELVSQYADKICFLQN